VPSNKVPLIEKHYQHFTEDGLKDVLKDYFKITKCIGSAQHGFSRKTYEGARLLSSFLFPLRNRLPMIMRFYKKLNLYFTTNLGTCRPDEGSGIIAVCEKVGQDSGRLQSRGKTQLQSTIRDQSGIIPNR